MRVAFFSNFLNHHQLPFSQAMVELTNNQYTFVATEPVPQNRIEMGYQSMNDQYPFVLKTYEGEENRRKAVLLANESDIVVIGSAPSEFVRERIQSGKLTFFYSERIYKEGYFSFYFAKGFIPFFRPRFQFQKQQTDTSTYMLCASAYTAGDLCLSGLYKNKTFKWGYYPEVKKYDIDSILSNKWKDEVHILWAGRMLPFKHPEMCIDIAEKLIKKSYRFHLNMIGSGELHDDLKHLIERKKLTNYVSLLGFLPPVEVRKYMEQSDIYLFTSDYNEGWGAVLNEAMNSGCAVVSSDAIGSTKFLIRHKENGLVFKNGNSLDLFRKVRFLMEHPTKRIEYGKNAYRTLTNEWNAEEASKRLLYLSECLLRGDTTPYTTGPCSVAKPIIKGRIVAEKNVQY